MPVCCMQYHNIPYIILLRCIALHTKVHQFQCETKYLRRNTSAPWWFPSPMPHDLLHDNHCCNTSPVMIALMATSPTIILLLGLVQFTVFRYMEPLQPWWFFYMASIVMGCRGKGNKDFVSRYFLWLILHSIPLHICLTDDCIIVHIWILLGGLCIRFGDWLFTLHIMHQRN